MYDLWYHDCLRVTILVVTSPIAKAVLRQVAVWQGVLWLQLRKFVAGEVRCLLRGSASPNSLQLLWEGPLGAYGDM